MSSYTALLDANVLYPAPMCDVLMQCDFPMFMVDLVNVARFFN